MHLTAIAPQPLKPIAAKGSATVPSRASCRLLRRRTNHSSPLPAPSNERRRMGHCSCPAARTKARDEAEPAEPPAPAEEGEEASAAGRSRGERSMAYQLFEAVYVCLYVLSWRLGELIVVNAEDALERLRGYVRDKFNRKR